MTRYAFVQMLDRTHRLYTAKASDKKIKEVKYDPCYSEYHLYLIANGYIGLKTKEELCDTTPMNTAASLDKMFGYNYFNEYFNEVESNITFSVSEEAVVQRNKRKCDDVLRVDITDEEPIYITRAFLPYLKKADSVGIGNKVFKIREGEAKILRTILCHFGEYGTVCVLPTIMRNK